MTQEKSVLPADEVLIGDIRLMIDEARGAVAVSVNATVTRLYWHIGQCILRDILEHKRAEYGAEIVASPSRQ